MQVARLVLTQVRAFEQAEFTFQPGMNLIVGINGVGKSTALDAIRFMLAQVLPRFTAARAAALDFSEDDIAVGRDALTAELGFVAAGVEFSYLVHRPRERYVADEGRAGEVRDQAITQIERRELRPTERDIPARLKQAAEQPLAVYFSSHRSMTNMAAARGTASAGGQAAAFADALDTRRLRLRQFADWWLAQEALAREGKRLPGHHLTVLQEALARFLDGCANLRAIRLPGRTPQATLLLDKAGMTLDVRQLSDGERSIVALVLDVARRLAQANPKLADPLRDGQGVVLIDELDLHLHPRWQRTIVGKLEETFPRCQFIATTHSPQIIGEVKPEGLILLEQRGDRVEVIQEGLQGFGLDSGWILRHLMEADSRNPTVQAQIHRVEDALEEGDLALASEQLAMLRALLHGDDDEVVRLEASINTLEALADEMDTEEE